MEDVEKWTKGEDTATLLEGGDLEEYRVQRLMPIFGAHTPSLKPRSSVVPTAVGGEGVEVPGGAALEEVLRLLERVIYYSSGGQMQSDDIPSPEHMELALPPSVQQVSRKFVDKSFYCISGLSILVRQKSMVIEGLEVRLSVTRGQRVAAAGRSASAPRGGRGSAMGRGSGGDKEEEEDRVGSEDEEEGEEEEDEELASIDSGPSAKKLRR